MKKSQKNRKPRGVGCSCVGMAPKARPRPLSAGKATGARRLHRHRPSLTFACDVNFEQSGFCLSGTLLPVFQDDPPPWSGPGCADSPCAAHGRGALLQAAPRLLSRPVLRNCGLSAPKHGPEYGQDRPCRHFSNDINLRMEYPPRRYLSRHSTPSGQRRPRRTAT